VYPIVTVLYAAQRERQKSKQEAAKASWNCSRARFQMAANRRFDGHRDRRPLFRVDLKSCRKS
jgi:hypothetical protein